MEKKRVFMGIDPGKDGGISYIEEDGEEKSSTVTPRIGKEYDLQQMVTILELMGPAHVVLENINSHSAKGRQGAFVMGKGVAYWEMALVALRIPYTMVTPQAWQKVMWEGSPIQYKAQKTAKGNKSKDTKATSMVAAKRLFPDFDFRKSDNATNLHDGMVDSMLIAEYCRRKFR
jgi:hypothetical protein